VIHINLPPNPMIVCAAQLRSVAGDIATNLAKHLALIDLAAACHARIVSFPELSLTGYEPRLAQTLATNEHDARLDAFQGRADALGLVIGIGLPLAGGPLPQIGQVWFSPRLPRRRYAKQHLHADELPFFAPGTRQLVLREGSRTLVPASCYESLQPGHATHAAATGADVYLASVAKSAGGLAKAAAHYPIIAREHAMLVLMANGIGPSDDFVSAGQSAAWDRQGYRLAALDAEAEGIVLLDIDRQTAETRLLS
jgi:predicted amidohydrolase